jgi:hypothetical protein
MQDDGDRWTKICSKMRFNLGLTTLQHRKFVDLLQEFQDVFAWHKGKLGTCNIRGHSIDTQGFPPCRMPLNKLSFWEEAKVN